MSRLEQILKNPSARDQLAKAVDTFKNYSIFDCLREEATSVQVSTVSNNAEHAAAAQHYITCGYEQCLQSIQNIVSSYADTTEVTIADFGAKDRLLASGYSQEDIDAAILTLNGESNV